MKEPRELLAYCGFYCADCLGYTGVIADAAQNMIDVLDRYQFERTAECVFPEPLGDYDKLYQMLAFMGGLRCAGVCREPQPDERPSGCQIKNCCREKGFCACYECDDFEACDLHWAVHKGLHRDSCVKNMIAIREMGLEAWLERGRRYHYWDE